MKNLFFLSVLALATSSCSNELTNSKAEKIAKKCLADKNLNKEKFSLEIKDVILREDSMKLKNLEQEGYLLLEKMPRPKYYNYDIYKISLTEKSKPFIEETNEDFFVLKTNDLELEKVLQIQDVPAFGSAEVTLQLKRTNQTPFSVFSKDNSQFLSKDVSFLKTSDGWEWCQSK